MKQSQWEGSIKFFLLQRVTLMFLHVPFLLFIIHVFELRGVISQTMFCLCTCCLFFDVSVDVTEEDLIPTKEELKELVHTQQKRLEQQDCLMTQEMRKAFNSVQDYHHVTACACSTGLRLSSRLVLCLSLLLCVRSCSCIACLNTHCYQCRQH